MNRVDDVKCANYKLCGIMLPHWWFKCKGNYLCGKCVIMFGTWSNEIVSRTGKGVLPIVDNVECPICLETKEGITQPNCDHTLCINCMTRCYYGDDSIKAPVFPYPDIEDEYFNFPEDPRWENYPLIRIYNLWYDIWDDERTTKYESENHLRRCPLCRR